MGDSKIIRITHDGKGMKDIDKKTGDALHTFEDGEAHIDKKGGEKLMLLLLLKKPWAWR
jgi:hypothetical protein